MATGNRGARSKPRFYDWLIEQIHSNCYTGVSWLNDEHSTFRVPWKHLNQKNAIEEDVAIFKAWAIESRKYNEADLDWARWKINFHNALKSITVSGQRVFKEVHDQSKHLTDPHKVFRIYQHGALGSAPEGPSTVPCPSHLAPNAHAEGRGHNNEQNPSQNASTQPDQDLAHVIGAISLRDATTAEATHSNTSDWVTGGSTQILSMATRVSYISGNQPEENSFYDTMTQPPCNLPLEGNPIQGDVICVPALYQLELSTTHNPQGQSSLAVQPPYPASIETPCRKRARSNDDRSHSEQAAHNPSANGILQGAGASPVTQRLNSAMVRQGPIQHDQTPPAADESGKPDDMCCLQLNIYYRRKLVLHLQLNHNRYLFSYSQGISIHGPHAPVYFPSPAHLPDQKQVLYTTKVLEAIDEGLLLEVNRNEEKIYATWLGSSHYKVFWATAGQLARLASIPPPGFLEKNIATEIFNFQTFLKELKEYSRGQRRSPDFTIYLCFGQQFSVKKPKEEKLVLVEIVPQYCVFMYEFVQRRGASSLNSLIASLKIPSLFELIEMVSARGWSIRNVLE